MKRKKENITKISINDKRNKASNISKKTRFSIESQAKINKKEK